MAVRKCENCGATIPRRSARFCEFCGTEAPGETVAPPPPHARFGDLEHRFGELRRHPDLPDLMAQTPSTSRLGMGMGCGAAFLVVWTGGAIFMFAMFQSLAGLPFSLFPLLFVAFGVFLFFKLVGKASSFNRAPMKREPALIAGERTQVSGGGRNSSASTTYYVTLQFADGEREEYATHGLTAGQVSEGDLGVAYLKGGYLVDFQRVRV